MKNETSIERPLTTDEITFLREELFSAPESFWVSHLPAQIMGQTALKGKSLHLQWFSDNKSYVDVISKRDFFPKTMNLLREIADPYELGRAFLHRLQPGEGVLPHTDNLNLQFNTVSRMHLYYCDAPSSTTLFFDDAFQDINKLQNCVVHFSALRQHYYINNVDSSIPLYVLVFDLLDVGTTNTDALPAATLELYSNW